MTIQKRAWLLGALVVSGAGVLGCGLASDYGAETVPTRAISQASTVTVTVRDFAFSPATVTIPAGGTVVWRFEGNAPHSSTSTAGSVLSWDSGVRSAGQTFSMQFGAAGSYPYICTVHPSMQGRVVVQ